MGGGKDALYRITPALADDEGFTRLLRRLWWWWNSNLGRGGFGLWRSYRRRGGLEKLAKTAADKASNDLAFAVMCGLGMWRGCVNLLEDCESG